MPINMDVKPGDLITSELWKLLLGRIGDLETKVQILSGNIGTGTVTVPDVFGHTLKDARGQITKPALQLGVGFIIDAFGNQVDDSLPASDDLIVIGQMPQAGTRTQPLTSVNLAVSAKAGSATEPPKPPKITPGAFTPSPVPAGTEVTIGGENFAPIPSDNKVTFDGVAGQVSDSSTPTFLKVTVPKSLPNGPQKVGDPTNNNVKVHVSTPKGDTEETLKVSAPISNEAPPHIDTITPATGRFTEPLVINGTGFSPTLADNRVFFSGKPSDGVAPTLATPTQLTLNLPESLKSEFTTVPLTLSFDVVVRTKGVTSNTKPHPIRRNV
jgi:PASTA domain-containing protein/IPT/TIG domain-containing protein